MEIITVPAHGGDPDPVIEFVEEQLAPYDCSPKALYQIQVVIEEIVVNIVSYAQLAEGESFEVRCDVLEDPRRAVLQFVDGGVPFDPLAKDDPDLSPESLMEHEGGLGIFMVKQMMDDVTYAYEDGKNVLTVLKRLE